MKRKKSLITLVALFMAVVVGSMDSVQARWVNIPGAVGRWDDPAMWGFGEIPPGTTPHPAGAPVAANFPDLVNDPTGPSPYFNLVKVDQSGHLLIDSANVGANAALAWGLQGVGWGVNPGPPFAGVPEGDPVLEITGGQLDILTPAGAPNGNGTFFGWQANGSLLMSGGEVNMGPFGIRQNAPREIYSGFTLDMSGGVINATSMALPNGPDGKTDGTPGPGVSVTLSGDAHLNSSGGVSIGGVNFLGDPIFADCGGADDCSPNMVMSGTAKITAPEPALPDLFQKLEFEAAIARGDVVAAPGFSLLVTHDPSTGITTLQSIPEPVTIGLLGLGALLLAGGRRKR